MTKFQTWQRGSDLRDNQLIDPVGKTTHTHTQMKDEGFKFISRLYNC